MFIHIEEMPWGNLVDRMRRAREQNSYAYGSTNPGRKPVIPKQLRTYVKRIAGGQADKRILFNNQTGVVVDYNGIVLYVNGQMPQGDSDGNREGNLVIPKKLEIKLVLAYASADSFNTFRVVIYQYLIDSAITPPTTADTVDQTQLTFIGTAQAPYSWPDPNKKKVVRIIYDRMHTVGSVGALGGGLKQVAVLNLKFKKLMKLMYPQAGSSSAVGEFWMNVYSDSAAVTHPAVEFTSKLTYVA